MSEQMRNQITEAEKIDLIRVINQMWKGAKRYWLVLLLLILMGGGIFYARADKNYYPMYSASATFTINSDYSGLYTSSNTGYLNSRTANQVVRTFPYILNSSLLRKKVAEELGRSSVPGSISTESLGDTNMITIVVRASDPDDAYNVLNAVIKHYPEVAEPVIGDIAMNLLDITDVPENISRAPSYKRVILKGMILGGMLGMALLLVYAFTRNTVHEEDDFKNMLNVDCICTIPQIVFKKRGKEFRKDISIYNKKISQSFLEAVRVLRARIEKEAKKNDLKVFLVSSAAPGEGKSTIASNIAMALAMRESKVVLVDCDLRNPSVRTQLNMEPEGPGLYDYLTKKKELSEILKWNANYKMHVVPGGEAAGSASELLDSPRMHKLLEELKGIAEYVILDTAPVGILTDTAVLAEAADAALFVVKQDFASCSAIMEGIGQLAESGIYISGCILNGAQSGIGGYGYKNYRYYNRYSNYFADTNEKYHGKERLQEK